MMTAAEKFDKEVERWSNFGIELYDQPIHDLPWTMFNLWLESHFTMEGQDWIDWYLFERVNYNNGQILACYNEDGSEFYIRTLNELWDIVEPYQIKPMVDTPCKFNQKEQCTAL